MDDPAIRDPLARDRAAFDEFALAVASAARAAGLDSVELRDKFLKVGRGGMHLEYAFHRRHIPDALPRLMTWFKDQIMGRNPQDRPGHFLQD